VIGNRYGSGSGTIWLDNVQCVGNERSITVCDRAQMHNIDCDHSEDVSVSCGTSPVQYGNHRSDETLHRTASSTLDPKILGDGIDQTPQRTGDPDTLSQPTTLP